jgi:processed acidic surface protein
MRIFMKKLGVILLSFALLIGTFPKLTMAAQNANFEQDFALFLTEVSDERGFEVTKEDIESSLAFYEMSINEFRSVNSLSNFLGEVIKADLSNFEYLYKAHELDKDSLIQVLHDNDDDINNYIFIGNLDSALYTYTFEQEPNFEQNLVDYLAEVSAKRGFEVTKEDIQKSLAIYKSSIEEFATVDELSDFLGTVIKADLSNLYNLYKEFDLDKDSLMQLLLDNDDDINNYVFYDDLVDVLYEYTFEQEPNFEQNLVNYLAQVSQERGFEVTKEDINSFLASYDMSTDDFETVEWLSDFLGDVIKADLSNLDYFEENYDMDKQAVLDLLVENGEDINDYVYMNDLEETVWTYYEGEYPGMGEDIADELLPIFEKELDLTKEELEKIGEYLLTLEDHLSSPETMERLENLGYRMMDFESEFEDFDQVSDLSPTQIVELASIYNELLSIFKLEASYSLVKDGAETPLSIIDVISLKELKGAKLKVVLSSIDGEFLADLIVTGELVDSDTVVDVGEQVVDSSEDVTETVTQSPVQQEIEKNMPVKKPVKTHVKVPANGSELPDTATNNMNYLLVGFIIVLAGALLYRKANKA